jgi:hypothetical protein
MRIRNPALFSIVYIMYWQGFPHFSELLYGMPSVAYLGCLSRIRIVSIPDPNSLHPGSAPKNFNILNPNFVYKLSEILNGPYPDPVFTHPGSVGQKGTRSRIRDPQLVSPGFSKIDTPRNRRPGFEYASTIRGLRPNLPRPLLQGC